MLAFALLCLLSIRTMTVDAKPLLMHNTAEDHFKRPDSTADPMMTPLHNTTEPPLKGPHVSTPAYMMTPVQDTTEPPLKGPHVSTPAYMMTPVQDTTEPPLKGPHASTPAYMMTPVQDTTEPPLKGPHVSTPANISTPVQDATEPPLESPHVSTPVYMTPVQDTTEPPLESPHVSTPVYMMTPVQNTTEPLLKGPHVSTPVYMTTQVQDHTEPPLKSSSISTSITTPVWDTTEAPLKPVSPTVSHHGDPMMTSLEDTTTAVPEVHFKPQNVSVNVPVKTLDNTRSYKLSSTFLDMAYDSVDDMYHGCNDKMLIRVKRDFLRQSSKKEELFTKFTERCAANALKAKDSYDSLSWDHFKALCAYTRSAYSDLNGAVRSGKATYQTTFEFRALHFLLTDAIQRLKQNQRHCHTSYRRSKREFVGEVGQTVRFGSFASSSLSTELAHFGSKTCFEITTCFGAFLKSYTEFGEDEQEVLIPPYEMFTVVSVDRSGNNHLRCDVLYKLQTSGIHSSLNCQLAGLR